MVDVGRIASAADSCAIARPCSKAREMRYTARSDDETWLKHVHWPVRIDVHGCFAHALLRDIRW